MPKRKAPSRSTAKSQREEDDSGSESDGSPAPKNSPKKKAQAVSILVDDEDTDSSSNSNSNSNARSRSRNKSKPKNFNDDDFTFSQFDTTQTLNKHELGLDFEMTKPIEKSATTAFAKLSSNVQESLEANMTRYFLFRGLTQKSIEKNKAISSILGAEQKNVGPVVFEKASKRIHSTFGFELKKTPKVMLPFIPKKYENTYFLINLIDDEDGSHSQSIHKGVNSWEKGVLMIILSFLFCRGELRTASGWRYLKAEHLFRWVGARM